MDFHSMKRKQLQALCKKHKIPANLSNQELANKLTEFLKEKESADLNVDRKVKKVTFSPENELFEFTRSPPMKKRSRRNSGLCRESILSLENVGNSEMKKEILGGLGRSTRSRGLKPIEDQVNVKKRGRNALECDKNRNTSAVDNFDDGKLKEGEVDSSGRVMRGAKDDIKADEKATDDDANDKTTQEIVDIPSRVTRSRVQELTEVHAKVKTRGRKVAARVANAVLDETEETRVDAGEGKLARYSGERVEHNGKGEVLENKNIVEEHHVTAPQILTRRSKRNANIVSDSETFNVDTKKHEKGDLGLRKTTKLAPNGSGGSGETGNHVNLRRRAVLNTEEPIRMEPKRSNRRKNVIDNLIAETENRDTLKSSVPQLDYSSDVPKVEKNVARPTVAMRRSRRKTLSLKSVSADEDIANGLAVENPEAEIVNRHLLRISVPQLEIARGASKEETILQPSGVLRRSRRKTLNVTVVSADEKSDNVAAVENLEAENNRNKPVENECSAVQKNTRRSRRIAANAKSLGGLVEIGGDSVIDQKNKAMKRERGVISAGNVTKTQNDPCSAAVTMKEGSSKKAAPAAETGKVAYTRKRSRLNDFKLFDASSHNGVERELSHTSAKPSASEVLGSTTNLGIRIDPVPQNNISDMGLTSARKTQKKKPDTSIADGVESSYMKLINGKEFSIKDTKAASRFEEMKTDFVYSEGQISVNNIRGVENGNSALGIDVNELIEQYIAENENENVPEAHVLGQTEDLGCNNEIANQFLPDDLNEGFDETGSSTDIPLIGVQTDNDADMEVSEAEVDKSLQPTPCVVDQVDKVIVFSVQGNLDPDGATKDNQVPPENSNSSEKKGFAETAASPDSLVPGDQSDIKEFEAGIGLQPNPNVVGHISKANRISAQENLDSVDTRQDNQVLLEDSTVSRKEVPAETESSAGSPLLSAALGVAEVEADTDLQPNSGVLDHVGEAYGISAQENLDSDETKPGNLVLPERSTVFGNEVFAEIGSSAGSPPLVDQIDVKTDLEVTKAEALECLETSPVVVEHVGEVKVISVQNNLEPDGARFDNQGLGETGFFANRLLLGDQTDITADLEVAEAEADICLEPNRSDVDYAGEVPRVCVQENMDCNAWKEHNHVLWEGSFVSGNGGFDESNSSAERLQLGEVKTDLDVAEAEGDKCLQSSTNAVDHVSEVKVVSSQENLYSGKARQSNDMTSSLNLPCIDEDHLEASNNILDNSNYLDRSPEAGVFGAFESCEAHIDYIHAKCTFGLEALSSGMLGSFEGENLDESNKTSRNGIAPELAESNEDECLDIHKSASYKYSGLGVSYFSDGEGSARIGPQDRVDFSGEHTVVNSHEQGKYKDAMAVASMTNSSEIPQIRGDKTDHKPKREETDNDQRSNLEDGKSVEIGGHKSKGDEDGVYSVYNLFDAEERPVIMRRDKEIIAGEQSAKDIDDQGMVHGSSSISPTTMCHFARDLEADLIAEGIEAYVCNVKQSELIGAEESGCYQKNNKSLKDEVCTPNISHLFDGENSARITPQDKNVTFPDFVSTTCASYNELQLSADSSSIQDISPSKPKSVSESQGELSKSQLAAPTSIAKTTKFQKAWSNASETGGHDMCLLEADTSKVVEATNTDEDANDANCSKDREDFGRAYTTDVKISMDCTISQIEVESLADVNSQETDESGQQQSKNLPARQIEPTVGEQRTAMDSIQSWTGLELRNLFTSSIQEISPYKPNSVSGSQGEQSKSPLAEHTSIAKTTKIQKAWSHSRETAGNEMCLFEADTSKVVEGSSTDEDANDANCGEDKEDFGRASMADVKISMDCTISKIEIESLADVKSQETDGSGQQQSKNLPARQIEPTVGEEHTDMDSIQSWTGGIELCNLFTSALDNDTPGIKYTPSQGTEKANLIMSANKLISSNCGSGTKKNKKEMEEERSKCEKITNDNVFSASSYDDNVVTENEPDEKINGAGYELEKGLCLEDPLSNNSEDVSHNWLTEVDIVDGNSSKEQLTEGMSECLKEHKLITEAAQDENLIPLGESCLFVEAPDGGGSSQINSTSLSDSPRKVAFELSFSDLQKLNVPPKSHQLTTCSEDDSIFGEASIETFRGPMCAEVAKIDCVDGQKDVIDTGASPGHHSKDEITERVEGDPYGGRKVQDESETCGNTTSSQDNIDIEKSMEGTTVFNNEGENIKEGDEGSTATMVQFSISQFHIEEKLEDFSNLVHSISDVSSSGCTEILKESDVDDTIKEYIDSESSLSMIYEDSGASLPIDALAHSNEIENAASSKFEDVTKSVGEGDKPLVDSLEGDSKELQQATSVKSPACDFLAQGPADNKPLFETKGNDVKLHPQKQKDTEDGHRSELKKNARSILIHGTPGKLGRMADMKENAGTRKSSNVGDLTTVRTAKRRRALQDVPWK